MTRTPARTHRFTSCTALSMALCLVFAGGPVPIAAAQVPAAAGSPSASLSGRVFLSDGRTPVQDAVVKAFHHDTDKIFQSTATGPDGSYSITGLTPGEYDLGIMTADGVFVVESPVRLGADQRRAASLSLQPYEDAEPAAQTATEEAPQGGEPKKADEPKKEPEKPKKLKRARSAAARMHTPWVATGIIVGGAVVIGAIAGGGSDSNGSPN